MPSLTREFILISKPMQSKLPRKGRKRDPVETLLAAPQPLLKPALSQLRYAILADGLGIPEGYETCPYRCYVWSVLLRVSPIPTSAYLELIDRGAPQSYAKVRNDSFRTLPRDQQFSNKVSEASLVRILSAYAWTIESAKGHQSLLPYVQGMNILAAPFAFVCKSEPEAFALFHTLLTRHIPLYVTPTLEGVHTGAALVDKILRIVDPKLQSYLASKLLTPEMYAFPLVLTLSTCTPPLAEALQLWDFLFAYGCHMNVLLVVAQLVLIRTQILESKLPMQLLRNFPPLRAKETIKLAVSFVTKIPSGLYHLLVKHPFDPEVKTVLGSFDSK